VVAVSVSFGGVADAAGSAGRHGPRVANHALANPTTARSRSASIAGAAVSPAAQAQITSDANWIIGNQFSNGAIAQGITPASSNSVFVDPYTANYAAIGLARAASVTGNEAFGQASWAWLKWYASNEQPSTGFVSDATMPYPFVSGDASSALGKMDSTDAYAGTFLLAVYDTMVADPNASELQSLEPGIVGAVQAIRETQQSDGLTWALPTYQMAYLMDNAEAHAGLLSAASLEAELGNPTAELSDAIDASRMEAGIQSLWNPRRTSFDWAETSSGVQITNWNYVYPDAAEQAWAVGLGAATPSEAGRLMSELGSDDALWSDPAATSASKGASPSAVGYWPGIGWGFDVANDAAKAEAGEASIETAASSIKDYWPFTTEDAGQLIVLLAGGPTLPPSVPAP
jgi:hypothetical protein